MVPSTTDIHELTKKVRSLLDKMSVKKCHVLTKEKLDETGAGTEHTPQKSLRHLAQGTGISKFSTAVATVLFNLWPYKVTVVYALQLCDLARRINFCKWFLQLGRDGEVGLCFFPK
jgi:hypothetical protein